MTFFDIFVAILFPVQLILGSVGFLKVGYYLRGVLTNHIKYGFSGEDTRVCHLMGELRDFNTLRYVELMATA